MDPIRIPGNIIRNKVLGSGLDLLDFICVIRLLPVGKRDPQDEDEQDRDERPYDDHDIMPAIKVLTVGPSLPG